MGNGSDCGEDAVVVPESLVSEKTRAHFMHIPSYSNCSWPAPSKEPFLQHFYGFLPQPRQNVGVGVHCSGDARMAHLLTHHLWVHPDGQHLSSIGVA